MPLVPERLRSRQDVKASISSQFWEQPVHSTKSVDGQLWSLPCEPPALNLTGSSGLSRTQQLLAAQAARVPFFPSYDGSSEGLVLDRVLAKAGGQRWWAALSGRVKAQRAYNLAATGEVRKVDAMRDLGNYALCARGRFQLGRRLTLNGVVEAPDVHKLRMRLAEQIKERREAAATAAAAPAAPEVADGGLVAGPLRRSGPGATAGTATPAVIPELEPCTAHATLRCVLPGHDLSATAGYNLVYSDSSGDVAHVPLAVSLDLASHDRQDGLQYRVGLHQVTAPPTEGPTKAGVVQRWRTSLYAQGAVAVEGEAHIWKAAGTGSSGSSTSGGVAAGSSSNQPPADAPGTAAGASKQQPKGGSSGAGEDAGGSVADEEPCRTRLASALANAAAAEEDPVLPRKAGSRKRGGRAEGQQPDEDAAAADAGQGGGPGMATLEGSSTSSSLTAPSTEQQQQAGPAAGAEADVAQGVGAPAATAGAPSEGFAAAEAGGAHGPRLQAPKLESFMRPLEQMRDQVGDMLHHYTHPQQRQQQEEMADVGAGGRGGFGSGERLKQEHEQQQQPHRAEQWARSSASTSSIRGEGIVTPSSASTLPQPRPSHNLLGLSPDTISATIADSVALLRQVKDSVERLTGNVQDGSLQRLSQQLADSRHPPPRRRPYSMLLAQPHLKLNAAMGCLARMPLPALRAFSFPHATLEPLDCAGGGGTPTAAAAQHARHASSSSLVSRASYSSQLAETWQPYFKGTALRVFASAGVSGQLGRFTRPFLDYTAASARIDVGLTSPHVVGVVPDPAALAADTSHRPDKHRAFALEGRGAWHALSVSLAQQVFGPLRARMDTRFALDPTSVPASEGERSTLKGVLQTALSVRPSLLETVYGFDVVLPGTEGAARLAVWVSPKRRECMAELRLF